MSMYDDMQTSKVSTAESNADLMVNARSAGADFGIPATDNADSYGIDQNLSATLQNASNAAQTMSATASAVAGAGRALTNVDAQGSRLGGIKESVGDQAKQTFAAWMKQRPEAAWRFLKNQTQPAWEPSEDASEASEGYDALKNGAESAVETPGKVKDAYRKHQSRKEAKINKKEGLAARNDRKGDKRDKKIEKISDRYGGKYGALNVAGLNVRDDRSLEAFVQRTNNAKALDRLRLRHYAKQSAKFHRTADKQRTWVSRKRRKKSDVIAEGVGSVISRRGFLIAVGGLGAVTASLLMVPSCTATAIAAIAGSASSASGSESLTSVENIVASFFLSKGLDELHTAAIMGNMYAESRMQPGNIQSVGVVGEAFSNETVLAFGSVGGKAVGLSQWDGGRRVNLVNYAVSVGEGWWDTLTQLDFFWDHDEWGTGWSDVSGTYTESKFMASTDLEEATEIFCYGWERPSVPRMSERIEAAQKYYAALVTGSVGGSGEELEAASAAQKRVVAACNSTKSPGEGWCAKWVSLVMQNAGFSAVSGNARDMYRSWCTSSNRSELKVGMIIAVSTHTRTSAGSVYGHVGIYIGDDQVMHNVGPIETMSLDKWIDYYGTSVTPRWGWANGIDLSTAS